MSFLYKYFRFIFIGIIVFQFTSEKAAQSMELKGTNIQYNVYIGGGLMAGGAYSAIQNPNNSIKIAAGGSFFLEPIVGLNANLGINFILPNGLYFATEINSYIGFGQNQTTMKNTAENPNTLNVSQTSDGKIQYALSNGTNGIQFVSNNFRLGYALKNNNLAFFGILGWGYDFSNSVLTASKTAQIEGLVASANTEGRLYYSGFALQYGAGMVYKFSSNLGFYLEFLSIAPFSHVATFSKNAASPASNLDGLKINILTEHYTLNIGLVISI